MKATLVYCAGLALFLVSLFLHVYSPLGAVDYTGWNALTALPAPRLYGLLDAARPRGMLAALVIVAAGLNNLLAILSPLLFPLRRHFRRVKGFRFCLALLLFSALIAVIYILLSGLLQLRYGCYVWLLAITLIDLSMYADGEVAISGI